MRRLSTIATLAALALAGCGATARFPVPTAETRSILLSGLNAPFGIALVADTLYVANSVAVVRFPYSTGQTQIFVPFTGGKPAGPPIDVLTGFVKDNGEAMGRPVGVAIDSHGARLVADDVGNVIWRVTSADPP